MTKVRKKQITAEKCKGKGIVVSQPVVIEIPTEQEMKVLKGLNSGMEPTIAMAKAGYNLPDQSAEKMAKQISEKYNDRLKNAYEVIQLTPEFIAQTHKDIMVEGKDSDRLKAIDQVLQIQGGYAPKQLEVKTETFEQAVTNICQVINIHQLKASDIKTMLAEDAEIIEDTTEI